MGAAACDALYGEGGVEAGSCDTAQAPANVSEDYGVFVNGDVDAAADADGSKDKPFKTIEQALENLAGKSRVFVCASSGAYAEQVNLPANVSLFGGFECGSWMYNCEKPKVAPDHPGVALSVSGSTGATVADMEFVAKDAPSAGDSSIAVFIANSTGIVLQRVTATAGNGMSASSMGNPDSNYCDNVQGNAGGTTGGLEQVCDCTDGTGSVGGKGGDANAGGEDGKPTIADGNNDGTGGAAGSIGHRGADSNSTANGGDGAADLGELLVASWQPASGSNGTNGSVGQGGGGGGGGDTGGGGGGAGGCGGAAGPGGAGGGASIVIAVYKSNVTISECNLTSGKAGDGGQGGKGEDGQGGGAAGVSTGGAAGGGRGGSGSGGGGGGGGAGGISVGVLFSSGGTVNIDTATTVTLGAAGNGGAAGTRGAGGNNGVTTASSGSDGQPGVAGFSGAIYPPNP